MHCLSDEQLWLASTFESVVEGFSCGLNLLDYLPKLIDLDREDALVLPIVPLLLDRPLKGLDEEPARCLNRSWNLMTIGVRSPLDAASLTTSMIRTDRSSPAGLTQRHPSESMP